MSSKVKVIKIVPNNIGYRQLLNSVELQKYMLDLGMNVASSCGSDYAVTAQAGRTRLHVRVATTSQKALNDNYDNNTLVRAVSK